VFVGHFAVAFAAKRISPPASLGWFVAAATAPDLLWPLLLLAGIEKVSVVPGATAFTPLVFDRYPWSHSLLMTGLWGAALAALAHRSGLPRRAAGIVAALVVSHWVLDAITHAPDLPLWPGSSPRFGLELWSSIPATLAIEGLLWAGGLVVYLQARRPRSAGDRLAFWSFAGVSTVLWVSGPWSPPPPSPQALARLALVGWIVVPWAVWLDRRAEPETGAP